MWIRGSGRSAFSSIRCWIKEYIRDVRRPLLCYLMYPVRYMHVCMLRCFWASSNSLFFPKLLCHIQILTEKRSASLHFKSSGAEKVLRCRKQAAIHKWMQTRFALSTHCNHLGHVALWSRVLSRVFHPHQNQEVKVVPHVVFWFEVLLKRHRLVVKFVPFQPCRTSSSV